MKRKILSGLLCALLTLSLCVPAYGAGASDVEGHWARLPLEWAQEEGILLGTGDHKLSPNGTASRAMAVTVLYRYAGEPAVEGGAAFADVPDDAYYAKAVAWAAQAGILTGRTETAFCPQDAISRQEFATVLYRFLVDRHGVPDQVGENNVTTLSDFADRSDLAPYAQQAMAWAVGDLFLSGVSKDGVCKLLPRKAITRGEMAQLLRQYDCLVEGNPAQLYQFQPDQTQSIELRSGMGDLARITDPAQIQRFLEKVNAFTYTRQVNPDLTGGFYYVADIVSLTGEKTKILFEHNGMDYHYAASGAADYFETAWMQSFYPTA